ncbi:MAG TPA: amidohydrolase family protein [Tepidisphaeraceae bacterium]|nr:amidohydrolase family protein [Tepidisphaeraceae bacterium]
MTFAIDYFRLCGVRRCSVMPAAVLTLLLTVLSCGRVENPRESGESAGRAVYVDGELLKDFKPKSQLATTVTQVDRPRFQAIDIHCHWSATVEPANLIAAMDRLGIKAAVNLSGGWGDALETQLARYHRAAPERLLIFANVEFSQTSEPGFATKTASKLRDYHRRGIAGLKVFKSLGLTVLDSTQKLVAIDDERLGPIWEACGELQIPVLIHAADPPAFFEPVDSLNERWMQLKRHPDWSFAKPPYPPREVVLRQRNRVFKAHPRTVFIVAHLGEHGDDLKAAARLLDEFPNLYMDLSGREAELGRQPYAARRFLIQYANRILFGTDRYPGRRDQPRNQLYYRLLETDDEYFDYYDHPFPPGGDWKVYGLFLPDEVLRRIYHDNAARALRGLPPLIGTKE